MKRPVGFFDSGIGGMCILNAFRKLCPDEETVYIADSANCPYGNKSPEEIVRLSEACVRKLLQKNCKMIVIACNTATAAAIDYLRAKYPLVPFVGLEPAVKPAALRSKTGVVGVLATAGTFNGRLYNETKAKFAKNVTVLAAVADEFVIEVEKLKGQKVEELTASAFGRIERMVRQRVEPLLKAGADRIVLGCTHFPHLKSVIEKVCAGRAEVIDPSEAVARQAKRVLEGLRERKVVLHTCCGPCASACVSRLKDDGYEVIMLFANSNIDTREEFEKRMDAARKLAECEGVRFHAMPYHHDEWLREVAAGYEGEQEGGARCARCFRYNLLQARDFAARNGCGLFTTSLTVSPHKSSKVIFEVAESSLPPSDAGRFPAVGFLPCDFKKKEGFKLSVKRAKELGLYRQSYCGCEFSRRQGRQSV